MCVPGVDTDVRELGLEGTGGADGAAAKGVDGHQVGMQVARCGPGGPPSFVSHFKGIL